MMYSVELNSVVDCHTFKGATIKLQGEEGYVLFVLVISPTPAIKLFS